MTTECYHAVNKRNVCMKCGTPFNNEPDTEFAYNPIKSELYVAHVRKPKKRRKTQE